MGWALARRPADVRETVVASTRERRPPAGPGRRGRLRRPLRRPGPPGRARPHHHRRPPQPPSLPAPPLPGGHRGLEPCRHRVPDPERVPRVEGRLGAAGRGDRRRPRREEGHPRGRRAAVRLPGARHGGDPLVLRPRGVGAPRSGSQEHRGRPRDPASRAPRLRDGRARARPGASPGMDDVRDHRWRPHGCGAGRSAGRDLTPGAVPGVRPDRSHARPHHPGRGGVARAPALPREPLRQGPDAARAAGRGRLDGSARHRDRRLRGQPRSASGSSRAPSCGRPG